MKHLPDSPVDDFSVMSPFRIPVPRQAIIAASQRPELVAAMKSFYARADELIAGYRPICWNRGECCRFGEYGHRLFVTTLEAACFLSSGPTDLPGGEDACPYARQGQCQARPRRPLACRIFHCDPAALPWQGPLTEQLLAELRDMHGRLGVPYHYMEWMAVLRALSR